MADVSQVPPGPGGGLVGWILGGIAAALGIVWAALQSGRAKEIARLEASLEHERKERKDERDEHKRALDRQADEHKRQLERIGERLDESEDARRKLELRLVRGVLTVRSDPTIRDSFEEEFPTGVRMLADLVSPASTPPPRPGRRDPHPELENWDPNQSTPPKLKPPRP